MDESLGKMKKKAKEMAELMWKKIDPEDLKPGDHIYCHKRYGSYSHHGIYVGEGFVIHFNRTEIKNTILQQLPKAHKPVPRPPCQKCGYDDSADFGAVKTCLDCFRLGTEKRHSIRYYAYGASRIGHRLKKPGTCTMVQSIRTADEVVGVAYELLRSKGFGKYDLRRNNCEHFATFCRTGQKECEQMTFFNEVGNWVKRS